MGDPAYWSGALCAVLEQGAELAARLDREALARPVAPWKSGVGAHLRHVADFVRAFLDGQRTGRIDFDARRRDERLEREPARAAAHLRALVTELDDLGLSDADSIAQPVLVRSEAPSGSGPRDHWLESTIGRELAALLGHTVHHYALVAVALHGLGIEVPDGFGVAPSTLDYQRARSA